MKRLLASIALAALTTAATAQKIDFNKGGRPESEGLEPGYTAWAVNEATSASATFDGVTVTLRCDPAYAGQTVMSDWWKQGVVSLGAKLVGDGVVTFKDDHANISSGAVKLDVVVSGLPKGTHSLQAYHNNINGYDAPPLDVYVDGELRLTGIRQTNREQKAEESGQSYVEFDVSSSGQAVTVSYVTTPADGVTYGSTAVTLNALIFNQADSRLTATKPYPANNDMHADCDGGVVTLQWKGAEGAVRHHMLMGTAPDELKEVVANEATLLKRSGLSAMKTYYWRVDEETVDDRIYEGELWTFRPRRLAFPGAEGYGRFAIGGRGGTVYHVTSLDDDPTNPQPGTLRHGLTQLTGPRTIVFDVGGTITLHDRLSVSDPCVTIAGQTAPGQGILLRGHALGLGSDVVARFLRLHLGGGDDWDGNSPNPHTSDGIGAAGADHTIIDHCSIAWTIDEGFSSRNARNLTLQRTLISEALNYCGHSHYAAEGRLVNHGYAATIGGGQSEGSVGSFHHNLLAHNEGRNWSLSGGLDGGGYYDGHHDVFNNVVYNWGSRATDGGTHELNFVGNYYKKGPATTQNLLLRHQFEGTGKGTQSAYVSGNVRQETGGTLTRDQEGVTYRYELSGGQQLDWQPWAAAPFFESHATVQTAEAAYQDVLSDVGCNQPALSNHDARMVSETLTGTTSTVGHYTRKRGLIDRESDAEGFDGLNIADAQRPADWDTDGDGIADWFERLAATDPATPNNNGDRDDDGYTDLEEWLDWLAHPHFTLLPDAVTTIDLRPYFAGFETFDVVDDPATHPRNGLTWSFDGPVMTVRGIIKQLYTIPVTITDPATGHTMTRPFNIAVTDDASALGIQPTTPDPQPQKRSAAAFDLQGRPAPTGSVRPATVVISNGQKHITGK